MAKLPFTILRMARASRIEKILNPLPPVEAPAKPVAKKPAKPFGRKSNTDKGKEIFHAE